MCEETYGDEVELGTVELGGLALELGADRLHGRRKALLRGFLVVDVDGSLTDVHADDALHVREQRLGEQACVSPNNVSALGRAGTGE